MKNLAYEINTQSASPEAFYALACDPARSVAVEACAGSGKTWMLISRILRALLDGAPAHEILALTFTKKAAGEMRERLYDALAGFVHASDAQLAQELHIRGISQEKVAMSASNGHSALRNLYQSVLQGGRGVNIRTFHAWFATLLRSAPLGLLERLGLPASYELLQDDKEARDLAWRSFYVHLEGSSPEAMALRQTYNALVQAQGRFNAEKALDGVLTRRVECTLADAAGTLEGSVAHFAALYTEFAGLDAPLELLTTNRDQRQKLWDAAKLLGAHDGKIPQTQAALLEKALTGSDMPAALAALLTQAGTPRKFSDKIAGIEHIRVAQDLALRVATAQAQHTAWQYHHAVVQLGRALVQEFANTKRTRGWVDMGDIEHAATFMLGDAQVSGWVQERLDARVKHLLIDEFQDTNPLQWQALYAWLASYSGAGGAHPSVFIVGDPKQSIYRFRRAEPQVFVAAQAFIREGLGGDVLSCDHTRRNAQRVIEVVNAVMAAPQGAPDGAKPEPASQAMQGFRLHTSASQFAGEVLQLPLIPRQEKAAFEARSVWRDTLTEPRFEEEEQLATLECAQAARWIAQQLADGAAPSSFMVLARKRSRLRQMHAACQALGIPSHIGQSTRLIDCPEVQDVVALLDALVSGHDLSLAQALKSPMFSASDADLVQIALAVQATAQASGGARPSWWSVLEAASQSAMQSSQTTGSATHGAQASHADMRHKGSDPTDRTSGDKKLLISEQLKTISQRHWPKLLKFQALASSLPPHDALAAIFHATDALARFAAAAPAAQRETVQANLRALLAASLAIGGGRFTSAYSLVRILKNGVVDAPSSSAPRAVQLLTVHGAKGLEAHTVLLLDAHAAAPKGESMSALIDWPAAQAAPARCAFMQSETAPPPSLVALLDAEKAARSREETNALYVAMTRAQQRLVVSGMQPFRENEASWWMRLAPHAQVVQLDASAPLALHAPQLHMAQSADGAQPTDRATTAKPSPHPLSTFVFKKIAENNTNVSVISSYTAIKKTADTDPNNADTELSRTGQAMHKLLEWRDASRAREAAAMFALDSAAAARAQAMASAMLSGEAAWVWDDSKLCWQGDEVPMQIGGKDRRLDRLVQRADTGHWWVLDYKSASYPEQQTDLRTQLAAYAQAVQNAYPSAVVHAAFISSQGKLLAML